MSGRPSSVSWRRSVPPSERAERERDQAITGRQEAQKGLRDVMAAQGGQAGQEGERQDRPLRRQQIGGAHRAGDEIGRCYGDGAAGSSARPTLEGQANRSQSSSNGGSRGGGRGFDRVDAGQCVGTHPHVVALVELTIASTGGGAGVALHRNQ